MSGDRQAQTFDAIVRVVLEILESEGYEAVQPRLVAKRARVSLSTIYKFAPTREDLIANALIRWMGENCYSGLADPPPDARLYDQLMWIYRQIFEPWERNPRMLEAYHRAKSGPCGERVEVQGAVAVEPVARAFLAAVDPTYANDVGLIMTNTICGAIQRFASGEFAASEILPMIERTLFRLTANNEALAGARPRLRGRNGPKRKRTSGRRALRAR